jgi:Tol biopolymer transport system component
MAEVWLFNLVTGSERQLTETDCSDAPSGGRPDWYVPGVQGFSWSPDGRRIAYLATCTSGGSLAHLGVVDLEAGRVTSLTTDHLVIGNGSYPSWGPSGDSFILSREGSVYEPVVCVYIADLSDRGSPEVEPLPGAGCEEEQCYCPGLPTWSPNGEHIAYGGPAVGLPGTGARAYVSVVDIGGNHLTYEPPCRNPIPEYPDLRDASWIAAPGDGGLVWSNNSQYLAVASVRGYVPGILSLVEVLDGVAFMRSALTSEIDPDPDFFSNPVFSPNDEILYFVSVRPDAEDTLRQTEYFGAIYSVPVQDLLGNGSPDIQVVSSLEQLAGYPSLSSDGEWFVYAVKVEETVEIWLQVVDGTYRQRLVGDGFVNTRPAWRPE